jgi:hypothetical protein
MAVLITGIGFIYSSSVIVGTREALLNRRTSEEEPTTRLRKGFGFGDAIEKHPPVGMHMQKTPEEHDRLQDVVAELQKKYRGKAW